MIPARLKDDLFLEDVHSHLNDTSAFHLWWLGQSGFLLQWNNLHILIDPYLSDSLTTKYANTSKPHIRMSEKVIDPSRLNFVNVVTSSHNHTDHLDAETLIPLIRSNPKITLVIPEANRKFVCQRIGMSEQFPVGLNAGQEVSINDFIFHGIPAAHNDLEKDEAGNYLYMGYVIEFGKWKIYHSGDTLWYEGMADILRPFHVDVAILPINGHDPSRGVAGNLDHREAVLLGKAIGAKCVIPCHYNMFTFNTADPKDFASAADEIHLSYSILTPGDHWSSNVLR